MLHQNWHWYMGPIKFTLICRTETGQWSTGNPLVTMTRHTTRWSAQPMYDVALLRPCNAPIHDLLPATVLTDQITGITTATTSRWGFPIHSKGDSNHLTSTASLDDHPFYARLLGPSKKSLPEAMEKIS